jgi:FKBP-type peptidyl-prolyl cis-trans isomerase SlyD
MKISASKFVAVSYDLHVGDEGEERELMEQATTEKPLTFIFGTGAMLPAFEKELNGKQAGDTFDFSLSSGEAYGDFRDDFVTSVPKTVFHVDGKFDEEIVKVDSIIPMYDSDGNRMEGAVVEIREDVVVMDFNHPLAGETLHFNGKVLEVREPTMEEIAAVAHSSCGGSCSGCGGSCE